MQVLNKLESRQLGAGAMGCGGTTGAPASGKPANSGDGASAKCSGIYLVPPNASNGIPLDGQTVPSGAAVWFNEQVVAIELNPMIGDRQFCHDKSCGAMDETPGPDSYNGTIRTRVQCCSTPFSLYAGALAWLQVYPLGSTVNPIQGFARITNSPIKMVLENGEPVEHDYTFVSKGQWTGAAGLSGYIDACGPCACSGTPLNNQAELPAEHEAGLLDSDPVTVYEWTDSGVWAVAYSELPEGYTLGPTPDPKAEPGKKAGELKFVKCVKVGPIAAGA